MGNRTAATSAAATKRSRRRLLDWYQAHRRSLPWRDEPDPYRVLVSELMLQQTRVGAVIPYFQRFLERFPTLGDLARAPVEDVLAAWSGLGYYRRARHLHAAARKIVDVHGGCIPRDVRAVRDLPGVGRYTAGAIRSIAFGEADPVVDGNVARVLARSLGLEGDPRRAPVRARLWEEAARLLDPDAPGDFNQALMELGATVCTPVQPDCGRCPWKGACVARRTGRQEELPMPGHPGEVRRERAAVAVFRRGGRWLLVRRRDEGLLAGLWELPGDGGGDDAVGLRGALRRRHRLWAEVGAQLGKVRHSILDRRIELGVYRARLLRPPRETAGRDGWRWVVPGRALAGEIALSGAGRKVFRLLGVGG